MVSDFSLTVLGSRGSMAYCGRHSAVYGGDTSCYMVRAGEQTVFLDAGTGLSGAPFSYPQPPVILLSHLHLDHVIGLGMFPGLSNLKQKTRIYVPFCPDRESAKASLGRLFSPPFWPLPLSGYASSPELLPLSGHLSFGELTVDAIPGNHPGGCMVFRLSFRGKRIVYLTDYEYEKNSFERIAAFSQGADLLMFDAQYTDHECSRKAGFGHSCARYGFELMRLCGAKRLLLVHHDPRRSDRILASWEGRLDGKKVEYAREGQRIVL